MAALFIVAAACALAGVASLWSVVLPRALGKATSTRLRQWQLVSLRLGVIAASGLLVAAVAGLKESSYVNVMSLVWLAVNVSPIVLAVRIVRQDRQARALQ